MIVKFIGTGSAFCLKNYHSNMLIENNGKNFLIDAGGDVRFSLKNSGYTYKDIDSFYITHLHNDHIGGIEYLAFGSYFDPDCPKIKLFINKPILDELWSNSLKGGLASVQGKIHSLEDYFDIIALDTNEKFNWQGIAFNPIKSIHINNGDSIVPTFGLMILEPDSGTRVYHTSDTQFKPDYLIDYYKQADIVINDCETMDVRTGIHAHYDELKTLDKDVKSKMFLWHYQDNIVENFEKWQKQAQDDGFRGFLEKGSRLIINKERILYE